MSDLKTQRNVAIGVAAVAVAFVTGYVISRSGGDVAAPADVAPVPGRFRLAVDGTVVDEGSDQVR